MSGRRLLLYGEHAVLLECRDLAEALGLAGLAAGLASVREVVPGARSLLLRLERPLPESERVRLLSGPAVPRPATDRPAVEVPVDYSGADLAEVAELTGLGIDGVVAAHTGQTWTVAFCGFAPGFGYLIGEDDRLRVPRRTAPRTRVPAGAVGLADHWSGVYPRSGPGGWQLIGRTDLTLFDPAADPPAELTPGRRVRFVAR